MVTSKEDKKKHLNRPFHFFPDKNDERLVVFQQNQRKNKMSFPKLEISFKFHILEIATATVYGFGLDLLCI